MAITNKLGVWGTENDYGSSWYEVAQGRIVGFQANTINYASKMNQAFKNATLLSYTFAQILADEASGTFTIGAEEVTDLSTFVTNMKSAINSYLSSKSVANATNATNSTYATKIGTSNTHPAIGNSTTPVYVNSDGIVTTAGQYAGGTAVTLNGNPRGATTASFYAPTSAGTINQILKSNGSGAPVWANMVTYTPTIKTGGSTAYLSSDRTYLIVPTPGSTITLTQYIRYQTTAMDQPVQNTKSTTIYGPTWINTKKTEYEYVAVLAEDTYVQSKIDSGLTSIILYVPGGRAPFYPLTPVTNDIRITSSSAYAYYDMTVSM